MRLREFLSEVVLLANGSNGLEELYKQSGSYA